MTKLAVVVAGLALALPANAAAARFALGVERGFSAERVADRVEAVTERRVTVIGPFAVAVDVPSARGLAEVSGVSYVERLGAHRRLAFVPNDPLHARQWYANRIRAFDAWPKLPILPRVLVAVIDSGIDADHPELEDRIVAGRSFVKSPWWWDTNGHGTFVAGQIAAETNNALGIAGLAPPADLLVAKVVRSDGTISPEAEARAIRWAVDNDASVINLSFGGMRDPHDPGRDTYSRLEAAAVEYAVKHGVLVVAAVGNGDKAPYSPWAFANYPAALPHVLGVSAIARDGTVPDFSNRDRVLNDIAAPGEEIFSTLPWALTEARVACVLKGYSECGPPEFRRGEGTSFAAPQVAAAAAILMGVRPLSPDQVTAVLERSAADANSAQGCRRCSVGRDEFTGWGVLDITAAVNSLASPVPPADQFEPNDGAATQAPRLWGKRRRRITATLDFWNDQIDVYRVRLRRGQKVTAVLRGPPGVETNLLLWKPGTKSVEEPAADSRRLAARDTTDGSVKRVLHRARKGGWFYLEVKLSTETSGKYTLRFAKTKPVKPPATARRPGRT